MTAKEKRDSSMLYRLDKELGKELHRAKVLCYEYNHLHPDDKENGDRIMRSLLGKAGKDIWMEPPFYCDYGSNITLGDYFYSNHNLVILDGAKVSIGDYVFCGPNVGIYTASHPLDAERRNQWLEIAFPITIGSNVWIGGGTQIMPGVTIGDNTVIGGGSVVVKDIPSGVLAAGNPCRVIREITDEDAKRYRVNDDE